MVGIEPKFYSIVSKSPTDILFNPYCVSPLLPGQGDSPGDGMRWQIVGNRAYAIAKPQTPRILENKHLILTPIATVSYFGFLTRSLPIIISRIYLVEKENRLSKEQINAYGDILGIFLKLKLHEIAELERNRHKALAEKLSHNLTNPTYTIITFKTFLNIQNVNLESSRRMAEREAFDNETGQYSELLTKLTLAQKAYDIMFPQQDLQDLVR